MDRQSNRFIRFFSVNPAPGFQNDVYTRTVIYRLSWSLAILLVVGTLLRYLIAPFPGWGINVLVTFCLVASALLVSRVRSALIPTALLILSLSAIGFNSGMMNGSLRAPASVVFIITPLVGFFCAGKWGARFGLVLSTIGMVALVLAEKYGLVLPMSYPERYVYNKFSVYFIMTLLSYAMGAAYEVSRRESEEQIRSMGITNAHQTRLASLGELSAGIAHEINNPLSIIMAEAELMSRCKDQPEKIEAKIETILKASERMRRIIRGLQRFARSDSGDHLQFQPESCKELIAEAMIFGGLKAKEHLVEVSSDVEEGLTLKCNMLELEQVLIVLLNNAVDAIKGLDKKWIRVSGKREGNEVVIRVVDSGPGIPRAVKEKLFQPFYTTKPVGEGTGLGLSIALGIIREHEGSISCPDGQNTCFELRFPVVG